MSNCYLNDPPSLVPTISPVSLAPPDMQPAAYVYYVFGGAACSVEGSRSVGGTPQLLALNCNSSRVAVVDTNGIFNPVELHAPLHPSLVSQPGRQPVANSDRAVQPD